MRGLLDKTARGKAENKHEALVAKGVVEVASCRRADSAISRIGVILAVENVQRSVVVLARSNNSLITDKYHLGWRR